MAWSRVDDFDGTPATRETFGFLGRAFMLDLGVTGKKKLELALQPFLAVAEEYGTLPPPPGEPAPLAAPAQVDGIDGRSDGEASTGSARRRRRAGADGNGNGNGNGNGHKPEITDRLIRTWAAQAGMEVPARGRLRREVVEAYEQAH